jgi:DNA segregation ATPase FtsK/SpoIIIE, S-DNA-T family
MAKNKKRKDEKPNNFVYSKELSGLILILIAIVGIGQYGPVGKLIYSFSMFLVGTGGGVLLALLFVVGVYTTIKGQWPNFFVSRLMGLYIFIISILVFAHIEYVKLNEIKVVEIFRETVNNLLLATKNPELIEGGGIVGALFSFLFVKMFDLNGAYIVGYFLLFFGFIIFTGISIIDRIKWLFNKIKKSINLKWLEKMGPSLKKVEEEYEKDKKIIISSMDELTQIKEGIEKKGRC